MIQVWSYPRNILSVGGSGNKLRGKFETGIKILDLVKIWGWIKILGLVKILSFIKIFGLIKKLG